MKKIIALTSIFLSFNVIAYMPSAPSQTTAYDEFRTSDGASCRSAIGGSLMMYGGAYEADTGYSSNTEKGTHVGFSYSFGGGDRIDCSQLQRIETERAQLELEKLKAEVAVLKQMRNLASLEAGNSLPPIE